MLKRLPSVGEALSATDCIMKSKLPQTVKAATTTWILWQLVPRMRDSFWPGPIEFPLVDFHPTIFYSIRPEYVLGLYKLRSTKLLQKSQWNMQWPFLLVMRPSKAVPARLRGVLSCLLLSRSFALYVSASCIQTVSDREQSSHGILCLITEPEPSRATINKRLRWGTCQRRRHMHQGWGLFGRSYILSFSSANLLTSKHQGCSSLPSDWLSQDSRHNQEDQSADV